MSDMNVLIVAKGMSATNKCSKSEWENKVMLCDDMPYAYL